MLRSQENYANEVDIMDQILAIEDHEGGENEIPLFNRMTSRNRIDFDFDDTQ